jgi:hypothetical protein
MAGLGAGRTAEMKAQSQQKQCLIVQLNDRVGVGRVSR